MRRLHRSDDAEFGKSFEIGGRNNLRVLYSMAALDLTAAIAAIFVLMPMRRRMTEADTKAAAA